MPLYNEDPTRGAVAALVQLADCGSMPFGFLPQAQAHPHMLSSMGLVDNAALLNQAARRPNIASLLQHDLSTYIVSARQAEFAQRQHEGGISVSNPLWCTYLFLCDRAYVVATRRSRR